MHLLHSLAIWPNLELKTQPKQLLGYLPLDIALPAECFLNVSNTGIIKAPFNHINLLVKILIFI